MKNNIGEARRHYALLNGQNVTQDTAAEFFNVSPSTYKKWEQGQGKLNGEILCAIADKFKCSVDYLLCRTDDPEPYVPHSDIAADERVLIAKYRVMDDEERGRLQGVAESFAAASEKYAPDGAGDMGLAAIPLSGGP